MIQFRHAKCYSLPSAVWQSIIKVSDDKSSRAICPGVTMGYEGSKEEGSSCRLIESVDQSHTVGLGKVKTIISASRKIAIDSDCSIRFQPG